jgi:hypothetical protein
LRTHLNPKSQCVSRSPNERAASLVTGCRLSCDCDGFAGRERCDHDGTTEPLNGVATISTCSECGKTWPTRFGAGARTVRIVSKLDGT